jgi:hypothetical protein
MFRQVALAPLGPLLGRARRAAAAKTHHVTVHQDQVGAVVDGCGLRRCALFRPVGRDGRANACERAGQGQLQKQPRQKVE